MKRTRIRSPALPLSTGGGGSSSSSPVVAPVSQQSRFCSVSSLLTRQRSSARTAIGITALLYVIVWIYYHYYYSPVEDSTDIIIIQQQQPPFPRLDFLVAGFPKSGTTSLLYSLAAHAEISMDRKEHCAVSMDRYPESVLADRFRNNVGSLSPSKVTGLKCPSFLSLSLGLQRLAVWEPSTRLVIGLRHPVHQVESYYNYRITELYDKGVWWPHIPALQTILSSSKEWKGVSAQSFQYHLFLQQLDKVPLNETERSTLGQFPELAVQPNSFQVFVYALEQLQDEDATRSTAFHADLQAFLGLETPLRQVGHENRNNFKGAAAHAETIRICDEQFLQLRQDVVAAATVTADWLWDRFVPAADVKVSQPERFHEILQTWKQDPCV